MSWSSLTGSEQVSYTNLAAKLTPRLEEESGWTAWLWLALTGSLAAGCGWVLSQVSIEEEPLPPVIICAVIGLFCLILAIGFAAGIIGAPKVKDRNGRICAVWDTLYYCHRCDVVYVPGGSGRCVPPDQIDVFYPDNR